jgi:protein phosphatase PTC7
MNAMRVIGASFFVTNAAVLRAAIRPIHSDAAGEFSKLSVAVSVPEATKGDRGEDAMFILKNEVGVFDGVGGWRNHGIDSGEYSRYLSGSISEYLKKLRSGGQREIALNKALDFGAQSCAKKKLTGSSTACIASLDPPTGILTVLNLGDSGLIVVRNKNSNFNVVFRATLTTHKFNFPYQIGNIGDPKLGQMNSDTSASAIVERFELVDGDIAIMATDGLWDNVFEIDVLSLLSASNLKAKSPADVTERDLQSFLSELCGLTLKNAVNPKAKTPWSIGVEQEFNTKYLGGKPDDLTVIVSHFSKNRIA